MESAAAVPVQLASGGLMECPQCGGKMVVRRSRMGANGRLRRFHCKACGHRRTGGYGNAIRARRFDDATVILIRQLPATPTEQRFLAEQYNCSPELIRQIQTGKIYTDLLPDWFRAPARASDPTCKQCQFYVEAKPERVEVDAQEQSCSLGIPEFETQGVRAIRDCSAFTVERC
jgi:predicted RNA-binding Zn-ribbon protein involved in translation (DUF1610 family)